MLSNTVKQACHAVPALFWSAAFSAKLASL